MFSVEPAVPAPPIAQRVPQWCFIFKTPGNIWPAVLLQGITPRDFSFHLSLPCSLFRSAGPPAALVPFRRQEEMTNHHGKGSKFIYSMYCSPGIFA